MNGSNEVKRSYRGRATPRSWLCCVIVSAVMVAGPVALAQDEESPVWLPEVRAAMDAVLAETDVPGFLMVVVEDGEIAISEAWGQASITGPTPMSRKTMFRIGALGDLGIQIALLRLSDQGRLDLDTPIGEYVDVHPAVGRVTANQLMRHEGGLGANHFSQPLWDDADLAREVRSWNEGIFVAEPGETNSHSHYSIALGGFLVESVAGKPFDDAMRELVWDPVGAPHVTVRPRKLLNLPVGQGHWMPNGELEVVEPLGMGFVGWPNALFASLDDMDRIALALAEPENGGRLRGDRPKSLPWTRSTSWGGISLVAIVDEERRFCALIGQNGWTETGAVSPVAQAVWQTALDQELPEPPPEIEWAPASPEVHDRLIGVYENETMLEFKVRDGALVVESGGTVEEVLQGGDNRFRATILGVPGMPMRSVNFSVEAEIDNKARLLRIGSRVWARTPR